MDENVWTKKELFAWYDGHRIVDLCELSRQLRCKQCSSLLDLRQTEREERYGLASVLFIVCNCGQLNNVHTGRTQVLREHEEHRKKKSLHAIYEINVKASVHLEVHRAGAAHILNFLALLDIPVPPPGDVSLAPVKEDADKHSAFHGFPAEDTSTMLSVSFSAHGSGTSYRPPSSPLSLACGPDSASAFSPVSGSLPSEQSCDRDDGHGLGGNGHNGCDDSDNNVPTGGLDLTCYSVGVNDTGDGDFKTVDQRRGNAIKREAAQTAVQDEEEEEYVPPVKIKARGHNSHKIKKSSAKESRKSGTREPLKLVVQRVPRTRAKVKKEAPAMKTVNKKGGKEQEADSKRDFSNMVEWSSTESEPEQEVPQNAESDTSWHGGEENQKQEVPRRGRGRPRGSTDKVQRARRCESVVKNSASKKEAKTAGHKEANGVLRCATCGKGFNSSKGYNLHMKRVHQQERHSEELQSQGQRVQERHKQETDSQETKEPPIDPQGQWHVVEEEEVTAELFPCPRCPSIFAEPGQFFAHSNRSHRELHGEEKGKLCPVPLKDVVVKRKSVCDDGSEVTSYLCSKCRRVFPSPSAMGDHLRLSSDYGVSCVDDCPDGARIRGKAVEIALGQRTEEPRLCSVCGKLYANQWILKTHMRVAHTQESFSCPICSVLFPRYSSLQSHLKTHEANRPRPFMCQTCGKLFFSLGHLKQHQRNQHMDAAPFACSLCGKEFQTRRTRDGHMVTHTDLPLHACSQCPKKFHKRYNLVVHERIHSGVKPYRCSLCPLTFAQKNSLDVHMKSKHGSGITPGAGSRTS